MAVAGFKHEFTNLKGYRRVRTGCWFWNWEAVAEDSPVCLVCKKRQEEHDRPLRVDELA
jgi:hypothetical protein